MILFIDELHTVVGAGAAEGAVDASDLLKPQLARGELACVGATTTNEYRLIEKDVALARRFQVRVRVRVSRTRFPADHRGCPNPDPNPNPNPNLTSSRSPRLP